MGQSKAEQRFQSNLMDYWKNEFGIRSKKTHEMLSSGKPDLRVGHTEWSQLDVELKVKDTGPTGLITGVSAIQRLTIDEMNAAGMPAVALIWDSHHKKLWITLDEKDSYRELAPWRVWDPVIYKRTRVVCDPYTLYDATRRLLNDRGYPSAKFLNI